MRTVSKNTFEPFFKASTLIEMDKLKFGIIGCGSRGIYSFGALLNERKDAEIKALCDPNLVRARAAAQKFGGTAAVYQEVEKMIASENLDAAIITSPDYCHEANAVAALEANINVLVDKPLSTTVKGCKHIIEAAKRNSKIVMMGFNLRHEPTLKKLKKIVDNGDLGKIFLIENREFYSGGRTYMSRWNRKYERSGGLWVHKGSHDFDVFNWLLGFPMPVKVSAFAGVDVLKRENIPFQLKNGIEPGPTCGACHYRDICPDLYRQSLPPEWSAEAVRFDNYSPDLCMYCSDKDTHDNGIAIVEYENGAKASHMECFITPFGDRRYTVMGDRGIAEVSLVKRTIEVHPRWTSETISYNLPQAVGSHGGADPVLLDSFIKTVRGEIPLSSTIEQGMRSTAIGQAAEISRRESRTVFIDELIKQQT